MADLKQNAGTEINALSALFAIALIALLMIPFALVRAAAGEDVIARASVASVLEGGISGAISALGGAPRVQPDRPAGERRASTAVMGQAEGGLAAATVKSQGPRAELLRRSWPYILAALTLTLVSLLVIYRSARRAVLGLVKSQSELRRALEAAEHANNAKSDFLASMSHEIRTPLNGVMGVLHLLRDDPNSNDGGLLLEKALESGEVVTALINDVLDLSKIEAGRMSLDPTPTDLKSVFDSVAVFFTAQCRQKGIVFELDVAAGVGWAMLDALRLRQCLFNLVGNAVKFTADGGVKVAAELREGRNGPMLLVSISDTGIGIAETAQAALFERFKQADGSTSRTYGGTGLGLAITRHLAELMDGGVRFVSAPGTGSTFRLEVAAPPASPDRAAAEADAAGMPLIGLRVLVVDDNATNRLIVSTLLGRLGAEVVTAEGGAIAIELAQVSVFDLILMDIQMPQMDGLETTRRLRASSGPVARIPIIALTANVLHDQVRSYRAAGMDGVVSKPISPALLLAEILRLSGEEMKIAV